MYTSFVSGEIALFRTQIYLTEEERQALRSMADHTGKKQSELIREAIDQMIERYQVTDHNQLRQGAKGMWKNRADLPDFAELRREWDRL